MTKTPLSDHLEQGRKSLAQERTPAYGDALVLCRRLEKENAELRAAAQIKPLSTREADDLWLECTKKHKRPGPAQLIEAFCELRNGTPNPAEYEPYDMDDLRALTAMHAGAPWCEEILPELLAVFSIADQLRRQNKRPVDPACGGEVWPS